MRVRKEIKYIISISQAIWLKKHLGMLMKPDSSGIDGTYWIRSQYYDSIADRDLHDNLDGVMEKRKIRLRIYSPDAKMVKLEYKCKSGSDGTKLTILLSRKEALDMEQNRLEFLLTHPEPLAGFLFAKMNQNLYRPKTIVEYERTALLYPVSDLRITFDRNIRASISPYGLFEPALHSIPILGEDQCVLEVKYNDFLAAPFREILNEIDQMQVANSKYSNARFLQN